MVEMAHMHMRVKAQFHFPPDIFFFGLASIIKIEKKHKGARYVINRFIFDGRKESFA
jgi:hypothetical protein